MAQQTCINGAYNVHIEEVYISAHFRYKKFNFYIPIFSGFRGCISIQIGGHARAMDAKVGNFFCYTLLHFSVHF